MNCAVCNKEGKVLYEDEDIIALLPNKGIKQGHILISPKKHVNIISEIEDNVVAKLYSTTRRLTEIFPALNKTDFNLLANNRADPAFHFSINLIPREENDGVDLNWAKKQINDEQLDEIKDMLSQMPISIVKIEERKIMGEKEPDKIDDDNYQVKQLERCP